MKRVLKQFKIYAPPSIKANTLNKDGTLTITGVASTTNQDLDGEIISEKALASLKDQAVGLNLHLDHNHDYNGGIGAITDAYVEGNALVITATVLKEHATGIRDRLALGMNMGFSIGGIPIIKNSRSNIIDDFILLEISLTLLPANWDTFGTVESKGLVESNCLTGACHYILKEKKKKMSKKEEDIGDDEADVTDTEDNGSSDNDTPVTDDLDENNEDIEEETNKNMSKTDKAQSKVIDDATKQELVNIVNEAIINLKPLILDELKEDMTKLVQEVVATSLSEVMPKALDGIKEEVKSEIPQVPVEEEVVEDKAEELPAEEVPVEEEKEAEQEETPANDVPADEVIEEEKEIDKVPLSGIPASPSDVEYANVANAKPVTAPTYTIDAKAVADAVIDEVWSKLNFKRQDKPATKFEEYRETQKVTTKSKFLDNETRDKFGRNKKYL